MIQVDVEFGRRTRPIRPGQGLDHLAPPDIPYENWLYYLELKRKMLDLSS